MMALEVFFLLVKGFYRYAIGKRYIYASSFQLLIRAHSYRLNSNHEKDFLISLRYLKKALKIVFSNKSTLITGSSAYRGMIFELSLAAFPLSKKYISIVMKKDVEFCISKENLGIEGHYLEKIISFFFVFILFLIIFPITLVVKRKGIFALIILEYTEIVFLALHLKKYKITEFFYFGASEKDANLLALLLQRHNIWVYKIPSEGSLQFYYKTLVTDYLCLTSAYQADEIKELSKKNPFFIKDILKWPPFYVSISETARFYNKKDEDENKNIIGYISSGMWRRIERQDSYNNDGYYESETLLMEYLKEYIHQNEETKLLIYFHPCEKETDDVFNRGKEYYRNYFATDRILFAEKDKATRDQMYRSNLGVSVYSNAIFERLYCGYKSFFAPFFIDGFPIEDSTLRNICVKSKKEFFEKMDLFLKMDNDQYFKQNKMLDYRKEAYLKEISATMIEETVKN